MEEIALSRWSEFQDALDSLAARIRAHSDRAKRSAEEALAKKLSLSFSPSRPLFRGQRDARWDLATTLERQNECERYSILKYLRTIRSLKPEIETYTNESWEIPDGVDEILSDGLVNYRQHNPLVLYEYMAYLRHHGFPSPLLDGTSSPYVAAFFAFDPPPPPDAERVSIFVFVEEVGAGKGGWQDDPYILSLGPTIRAHKRHFVQRSQYTICYRIPARAEDQRIENLEYWSHETAFMLNTREQDLRFKISIPVSERPAVLRYLDLHNITKHSLFDTTDTLMESLAIREYGLEQ